MILIYKILIYKELYIFNTADSYLFARSKTSLNKKTSAWGPKSHFSPSHFYLN